ncbi:MAG: dTDP-4-dehydrorhamnose reductase [Flavobacteriaceae bacterium]|nr:dTDP-4-dehydrorhamnose reductase [Flavobacteriaceae bacterium]
MNPILILGASGFIGNALYKELAPYYKIFGTFYSSKGYEKNTHFFEYNHEKSGLKQILREVKPKLIISALRGDFSSQLEEHLFLVNYLKISNCRIMFLSSANVFDSFRHYPSYEYDKTLSESIYGHFKIKIENQLMHLPVGKYIIIRLPMIFGISAPRTLEIDEALKNDLAIEVFPNTVINVNSDVRLRQQIHYLINHKKTGIYHLGSSDLISHFDFIRTLIERRHNKSGIFKQVFTSNTIRYLATLPKENKLPNHIQPSYIDVLNDLSLR